MMKPYLWQGMRIPNRLLAVGFTIASLLSACEFSDTDKAEIPAYIYIPSFTFNTDTTLANYEGQNSNRFTDMWITSSGNSLGTIGLPVLIPVPQSGTAQIGVDAGIIKSGQDNVRIAYPMVATYYTTVQLAPDKIDTIRPVFRYLDNVTFPLITDYDKISTSRGFTLNQTYASPGDSLAGVNDNQSWAPNNWYLKCIVSPQSTAFQMYTSEEYSLPGQGAPVYIEVDYRTNMLLQFGYYYQEPNQPASLATPVMELYPTDTWKKIYINLTDEISIRRANTKFKFYFGFFNNTGTVQPELSFDNIKLVTF
jgi:hypothetical protein